MPVTSSTPSSSTGGSEDTSLGVSCQPFEITSFNSKLVPVVQSWYRFPVKCPQERDGWVTRYHGLSPVRLGQVLETGMIKPGPRQGAKRMCKKKCGQCATCKTPSTFSAKKFETCMQYASNAVFLTPFGEAPVPLICILEVTQVGDHPCANENYRVADTYLIRGVWLRAWANDPALEYGRSQMSSFEGAQTEDRKPCKGDPGIRAPLPDFLREFLKDDWEPGSTLRGGPLAFCKSTLDRQEQILSALTTILEEEGSREVLEEVVEALEYGRPGASGTEDPVVVSDEDSSEEEDVRGKVPSAGRILPRNEIHHLPPLLAGTSKAASRLTSSCPTTVPTATTTFSREPTRMLIPTNPSRTWRSQRNLHGWALSRLQIYLRTPNPTCCPLPRLDLGSRS